MVYERRYADDLTACTSCEQKAACRLLRGGAFHLGLQHNGVEPAVRVASTYGTLRPHALGNITMVDRTLSFYHRL